MSPPGRAFPLASYLMGPFPGSYDPVTSYHHCLIFVVFFFFCPSFALFHLIFERYRNTKGMSGPWEKTSVLSVVHTTPSPQFLAQSPFWENIHCLTERKGKGIEIKRREEYRWGREEGAEGTGLPGIHREVWRDRNWSLGGGHCGIAEQPWSKPGVYKDYVLSLAGGSIVETGVTDARIRPALKPWSPEAHYLSWGPSRPLFSTDKVTAFKVGYLTAWLLCPVCWKP